MIAPVLLPALFVGFGAEGPLLSAFGLQHVLVMYGETVAPPLVLGSALHLSARQAIAHERRAKKIGQFGA